MSERYNQRYVVVKNGFCFFNGKRIYDAVKFTATVTPGVSIGRVLGERTPNTRWNGTVEIRVEMTRRRATPWVKDMIRDYLNKGITPEFTLSGVIDDKDSDYQEIYGKESVTLVGCVPTGDLTPLQLDTEGEFLDDTITFNAKDIKFK